MKGKRNWLIVLAVVLSGIWGLQDAEAATAGFVDAVDNSVTGNGVLGAEYTGTAGAASTGFASATAGVTNGVEGRSNSTRGRGVFGTAESETGVTFGVLGGSQSTRGRGVYGEAQATTGITYGVYGLSRSTSGKGVYGLANATSGKAIGVYGQTKSRSGYGVYSQGNMHVAGNFTASGSKSAVVGLDHGEGVTLYAVEASENWFEDAGSARLEKGRAVVQIDSIFARTVDTKLEYQVFLTPEGDCKGLYVTGKGETSFEVRELGGGATTIPFAFRVMAKRKGYADQRLARVSMEQMAAMASPAAENEPVPEDQ